MQKKKKKKKPIRQTWKTINDIIGRCKSVSQKKKKVLSKLMMVMLLMSQTKYQILLMISLLILDPNSPQA